MAVKIALSCNLSGSVFVTPSAIFSDFHAGSGWPGGERLETLEPCEPRPAVEADRPRLQVSQIKPKYPS